ncbi:MAG: YgiQ family radical SAM protein [Clostridia bacterium]|nr:YgiQ family radical SAM protein [Clostridia bacterium]
MSIDFLPVSRQDMENRGWEELDFLYVIGDAYVDHPSFGHAIISRVLESHGYKVGIIPQPDWHSVQDFIKLGRPRLGVLVSAGNIDSMVNHYTAAKKRRHDDFYSPGNKAGYRPDRATIVYCNRIREAFGDIPILIGGIEASLRRFAHYDYWDDKVRRSILFDSRADLLMYGMGEKQIAEIAECLDSGMDVKDITYVKGTCYISSTDDIMDSVKIPSFEDCSSDKMKYSEATKIQTEEQNPFLGKTLVQEHGGRFLVQNPPMEPLNQTELDHVYELPYMREAHPMYDACGGIRAIDEVRFSVVSSRGCFGGCNFCALSFHQGRIVTARSKESIVREVKMLTKHKDFKGYIHDVGGPTANFRKPACKNQLKVGACKNKQCLFPSPCKNLEVDHSDYLDILRAIRKIDGVKKVFIRSGIRFDYLMCDKDGTFLKELVEHHVSGQLKVAPEHISDNVLKYMGKPRNSVYERFSEKYYRINEKLGKKQFLVPYLMSSHPGSTLNDALRLAQYLRKHKLTPEQVQDFYPTPGTVSTSMYYTGLDPFTLKEVYVAKTMEEKAMQRALLQSHMPNMRKQVEKALIMLNREDLIGNGPECLLRPITNGGRKNGTDSKRKSSIGQNKGRTQGRGGSSKGKGNIPGTRRNNRGR